MSWLQLVNLISADVMARMTAANYPNVNAGGTLPLVDGGILIGPEHIAEGSAPPRIVFVPLGSDFGPRSTVSKASRSAASTSPEGSGVISTIPIVTGSGYTTATVTFPAPPNGGTTAQATSVIKNGMVVGYVMSNMGSGYLQTPTPTIAGDGTGATAVAILAPTNEQLAELATRSIWTDAKNFRVEVWNCTYTGSQPTPSPSADYDATEKLYQLVLQSMQALIPGAHKPLKGEWITETPIAQMGRLYAFTLTIATPVPDVTLAFPPVGTIVSPGKVQYNDPVGGINPADTVTTN